MFKQSVQNFLFSTDFGITLLQSLKFNILDVLKTCSSVHDIVMECGRSFPHLKVNSNRAPQPPIMPPRWCEHRNNYYATATMSSFLISRYHIDLFRFITAMAQYTYVTVPLYMILPNTESSLSLYVISISLFPSVADFFYGQSAIFAQGYTPWTTTSSIYVSGRRKPQPPFFFFQRTVMEDICPKCRIFLS